LIENKYYI